MTVIRGIEMSLSTVFGSFMGVPADVELTFQSVVELDGGRPLVVKDRIIESLNDHFDGIYSSIDSPNVEILEATDAIVTDIGAYRRIVWINHASRNNIDLLAFIGEVEISTWIHKRMVLDGVVVTLTLELASRSIGTPAFEREITNEVAQFYGFEVNEVSFAR
jgi:hypothetical protein